MFVSCPARLAVHGTVTWVPHNFTRDSTVKPSAAVASSAVASSALRDVVMAVAVVVPGTAMVAVIRTLAAVIVTSTADESTPATAVSGR